MMTSYKTETVEDCDKKCTDYYGCTHFEYCTGSNCKGSCVLGIILDFSKAKMKYPTVKCYKSRKNDEVILDKTCQFNKTGYFYKRIEKVKDPKECNTKCSDLMGCTHFEFCHGANCKGT